MTETQTYNLLNRYQKLIEITNDLASTLDLEALLDRIVQVAADLCDAEAASILLTDETSGKLHFQSATNLETPLMRGLSVPVESSIAGWIVTQRKPVIINDAQQDPRHFKQIGKATNIQTNSLLGVPLITKDKVVGVLEAINQRSGMFTDQDQELLLALGSQAAVAIENARLFQQSDLISELVHELRTPLTSLAAALHLIQSKKLSSEKRENYFKIMQSELNRLSDMATNYLDLARIESGRSPYQVSQVDLDAVIKESIQLMQGKAQERGLLLQAHIANSPLLIQGDRARLKQVVLNLLSNAIKYTPSEGKILLSLDSANGEAVIKVADTGVGIPLEYQPMIFEKFYRVPTTEQSVQGSGLGLFLCKRIVEAHKGTIELHSSEGEGTAITIHLPVTQ